MDPTAGKSRAAVERVPVLDGFRGLAILLVMLHHFFQNYAAEPVWIDRVVFGLAGCGWLGVDLFFVLSGFLITGILYDAKGTERYFLNFYARRTLRIFPLYYAVLVLFYVVLPRVPHPLAAEYVSDSSPDQLWFWLYLTNFRIALNGSWYSHLVPSIFWSLAIEEQFYLAWPLVVRFFNRRTLLGICIALFAVALTCRAGLWIAGAAPLITFVLTPARMDCLVLGAFLALVARGANGLSAISRWAQWLIPGFTVALVAFALPYGTLDWDVPLIHTIGFSLVALLLGSILVWALTAPPGALVRRVLETRFMRLTGKYSYAMYLFHGPAGTLLRQFYDPAVTPLVFGSALPGLLMYAGIAGVVTFAMAWLSWNLLERHCLRLQGRFRSGVARGG